MPYVKTNWQTGDIVTADKLNNLEDGASDTGILYIKLSNVTPSSQDATDRFTASVDKTASEIMDAFNSGKKLVLLVPGTVTESTQQWKVLDHVDYYHQGADGAYHEFLIKFSIFDIDFDNISTEHPTDLLVIECNVEGLITYGNTAQDQTGATLVKYQYTLTNKV